MRATYIIILIGLAQLLVCPGEAQTEKNSARPIEQHSTPVNVVRKYKSDGSYDLSIFYKDKKPVIGQIKDGSLVVSPTLSKLDSDRIMQIMLCDVGNQMALEEVKKGNYKAAETHFNTALGIALSVNDPEYSLRLTLTNLGILYSTTGRLVETEAVYRKLLSLNDLIGMSAFERASILDNLAQSIGRQNKLDEADKYSNEALSLYESLKPIPTREVAKCLGNRALILMLQSKYDDAITTVDRAIQLANKCGDHDYEATLYENKSKIYLANHNDKQAQESSKKAATIRARK